MTQKFNSQNTVMYKDALGSGTLFLVTNIWLKTQKNKEY